MLGVTLSRFLTDRENLQFCDSGMLPLVSIFSVTELLKMDKQKDPRKSGGLK